MATENGLDFTVRGAGLVENVFCGAMAVNECAAGVQSKPGFLGKDGEVVPHETQDGWRGWLIWQEITQSTRGEVAGRGIAVMQPLGIVLEKILLPERPDELESDRTAGLDQRTGIVAGFQATVITLEEIVAGLEVDHDRQKIKSAGDFAHVKGRSKLGLTFLEIAVTKKEGKVFMIAASHENAIRIGEFKAEQGIEHLGAVNAAIRIIAQENHVEIRGGDFESFEEFVLVEPLEIVNQRVNVAVKIAPEKDLGARGNSEFLCEGLKTDGRGCGSGFFEISSSGIEKRGFGLFPNPISELAQGPRFALFEKGGERRFQIAKFLDWKERFWRQAAAQRSIGRKFLAGRNPLLVRKSARKSDGRGRSSWRGRGGCRRGERNRYHEPCGENEY